MFVQNIFFHKEEIKRLSVGIVGAFSIHILILVWLAIPYKLNVVSADILTSPTNVSIRFVAPVQKIQPNKQEIEPQKKEVSKLHLKPIVKKVAKKTVKEPLPEQLNKIKPASAPLPKIQQKSIHPEPTKVFRPTRDIIPVISESATKGRRVQPSYPKSALRMRQQGVVLLHVLISENGERQDIKLFRPSKYSLLNKAAIKAVKKWTFDPHIVNGRPIKSWVEIPIEFRIQ